jgi:hypothetical protein
MVAAAGAAAAWPPGLEPLVSHHNDKTQNQQVNQQGETQHRGPPAELFRFCTLRRLQQMNPRCPWRCMLPEAAAVTIPILSMITAAAAAPAAARRASASAPKPSSETATAAAAAVMVIAATIVVPARIEWFTEAEEYSWCIAIE